MFYGISDLVDYLMPNSVLHTHTHTHTHKEVEHSGEGIYGYHAHYAKLFERIEHSNIR